MNVPCRSLPGLAAPIHTVRPARLKRAAGYSPLQPCACACIAFPAAVPGPAERGSARGSVREPPVACSKSQRRLRSPTLLARVAARARVRAAGCLCAPPAFSMRPGLSMDPALSMRAAGLFNGRDRSAAGCCSGSRAGHEEVVCGAVRACPECLCATRCGHYLSEAAPHFSDADERPATQSRTRWGSRGKTFPRMFSPGPREPRPLCRAPSGAGAARCIERPPCGRWLTRSGSERAAPRPCPARGRCARAGSPAGGRTGLD